VVQLSAEFEEPLLAIERLLSIELSNCLFRVCGDRVLPDPGLLQLARVFRRTYLLADPNHCVKQFVMARGDQHRQVTAI